MLKEFIDGQKALPEIKGLSSEDYIDFTIKALNSGVDFLRDSDKFQNIQINNLVTLLWRLIGNKHTPTILDQWGIPSLSFIAIQNRETKETMPLVVIPVTYLDQVRQDPINQLGGITFMASQCRDFITGVLNKQNSVLVNRRSLGYEAEALLTIQNMADSEEIPLVWTEYQNKLLLENPLGLRSLPKGMAYTTIPYSGHTYRFN